MNRMHFTASHAYSMPPLTFMHKVRQQPIRAWELCHFYQDLTQVPSGGMSTGAGEADSGLVCSGNSGLVCSGNSA